MTSFCLRTARPALLARITTVYVPANGLAAPRPVRHAVYNHATRRLKATFQPGRGHRPSPTLGPEATQRLQVLASQHDASPIAVRHCPSDALQWPNSV
jgi:hypothetical protein